MKLLSYGIKIIIPLSLIFFNFNCSTLPHYPSGANCTFTINQPTANYNCYTTHSGNVPIQLRINIIINFYDGNKLVTFDDQSTVINPATTSFPATIVAKVPNDGTAYYAEINTSGTVCSECANTYSVPDELPYGTCPNVQVSLTPPTYRAAKPRWQSNFSYQSFSASQVVDCGGRIPNVPNSCGCTVN
jgi:hypothetical protein